jgi:hypothetical protein
LLWRDVDVWKIMSPSRNCSTLAIGKANCPKIQQAAETHNPAANLALSEKGIEFLGIIAAPTQEFTTVSLSMGILPHEQTVY